MSLIHEYFSALPPLTIAVFVAPFVLLLLCIALLPLFAAHFWEKNSNKAIVSLGLGLPIGFFFLIHHAPLLVHTALDYGAFLSLLGALFIISGGIYIRGAFAGLPWVNASFLLIGAFLSNIIGTTGASMLLIRPLLRANKERRHKAHSVIFFIFIVSNCSGLLTPLGDPPLFLGFLKGVDFAWTLRLWPEWLLVISALLTLFYGFDSYWFHQEHLETKNILKRNDGYLSERFGILGRRNFILLGLVVGVILISGYRIYPLAGPAILGEPYGSVLSKIFQVLAMSLLAAISFKMTPKHVHEKNHFGFGPILEVAILFSGIFLTMIPALLILETQGAKLHVTEAWQFYWASGFLSSFLDNAPTYLTFTSLAKGALQLSGEGLSGLMHHPAGAVALRAISCGAVMMGANTYIGNGPNFMVKAIAEHAGVKMPGFFSYMIWSVGILVPLFLLVTRIFFS